MLYSIFKFNNVELRFYLFLGIFIGLLLYLLIFSKVFIKICVFIISIIKKIINFIVIIPIKFICTLLKKIFFKPIVFICISFKMGLKKIKLPSFKIKHKKKVQQETSWLFMDITAQGPGFLIKRFKNPPSAFNCHLPC